MWRGVFSLHKLLRPKRAWCASCYEEQVKEREYPYDLLLWSIQAVTICHKHHKRLCHICPHCGGELAFISRDHRPGYCSKCLRWLGPGNTDKQSDLSPINKAELGQQIMLLNVVGDLLSSAPKLSSPPTEQTLLRNIEKIIERDVGRSINRFSDLVGMWSGKIRRLLAGKTKLTIDTLYHLCTRLKLSPTEILCEGEVEVLSGNAARPLNEVLPKLVVPWDQVEHNLRSALQEGRPPSMEAIARRLGYYPPLLKRHFPTLCKQIISRYSSYIKSTHPPLVVILKTLKSALEEQPPPSLQSVFRRFGCRDTGYYYYSHYFELCVAIAQRHKDYRNKPFDRKMAEEKLRAALKEEPAPSFSSVARRLGHSREFFRQKFPELTKAIASRHMQCRSRQQRNRAEDLRSTIREIVKVIVASGLYVSERRVKERLRQQQFTVGRDSLFKQALREIKTEMGL